MTKIDHLLRPFACSIRAKVRALTQLELTNGQRARMLEAISDDIKKCTNFIVPKESQAAHKEAAQLGINLRSKNWHDQPQFDRGRKRFHLEHFVPVSAIRDACLRETSELKILKLLKSQLRVVWILKREDAKLTQLGYRSKRQNPDNAYRNAKILLVDPDD